MSRESAFRGTWSPNRRPYVVLSPDVYVAFQGETSVVGCGDCLRQISINDYVTGISTEASVDSPPGSATINLSIPDNDVNDFFVDGQFLLIPMMEVEIYAKGYFLVGGFPQYYKIFWGLIQSVTKSWSGGTTTITISCKDILRWWELTYTTTNPAFVDGFGGSAGNFQLWGNQFSGMNPYAVIIHLARESMGDFSLTTGSFQSFLPEKGPEGQAIGSYAKDIMAYWQLKFANIWSSLVMYGTSGQSYSFTGESGTVSPNQISGQIYKDNVNRTFVNKETTAFQVDPASSSVAAFKNDLNKVAEFEMFQTEQQSKLAIAMTCRDQSGYEFYCDTTGDIVFKPPFYNLNVMPNKPISWVQDFEIIDDSVTDSESEVYTHITGSGNAFGGTTDWGLGDEITTPRSGAFDFHLLRRYGWRKFDYQCEWAGDPRKLFFHMLDYLDRLNAKRQNGTVTIPMRPELRMGFPIWFPKYDSFFYVQGISHQFSVGGQATTSLTLIAKRSKFVAPSNIGSIKTTSKTSDTTTPTPAQKKAGTKVDPKKNQTSYTISFPDRVGSTTGVTQDVHEGAPVTIRDPKTGRILGYPNVVMVYRAAHDGTILARIIEKSGQTTPKPQQSQKPTTNEGTDYKYTTVIQNTFKQLIGQQRGELIDRLRAHRYEAGMTNAGIYDYAFDESRSIKEMEIIPIDSVTWQPAGAGGDNSSTLGATGTVTATSSSDPKTLADQKKSDAAANKAAVTAAQKSVDDSQKAFNAASKAYNDSLAKLLALKKARNLKAGKEATDASAKLPPPTLDQLVAGGVTKETAAVLLANGFTLQQEGDSQITDQAADVATKKTAVVQAQTDLDKAKAALLSAKNSFPNQRYASLNMMVRPVSDEFGFEVIGHYRYGRGSFIDRGQLKINTGDPQNLANQINVQFAPSGGFLTDAPTTTNSDPTTVSFSDAFEKMQPDDYVTGASFQGSSTSDPNGPTNIVQTSQGTYTNLINANTGKATFIEADATRRSVTLAELSPTVDITGLDQASKPCACGLGRATWLGLLPTSVIADIVNGKAAIIEGTKTSENQDPAAAAATTSINAEIDASIAVKTKNVNDQVAIFQKQLSAKGADQSAINEKIQKLQESLKEFKEQQNTSRKQRLQAVPKTNASLQTTKNDASTTVFQGGVDPDAFFQALSGFLVDKFQGEYDSNNAMRELSYTVQDQDVERNIPDPQLGLYVTSAATTTVLEGNEQSNLLGDPSDPLFNAASQGDPAALEALQNKANFNFGATKKALDNMSTAWNAGTQKISNTVQNTQVGPLGSAFGVETNTSKPVQSQAPTMPLPLPTIVDPAKVAALRNVTVSTAILNSNVVVTPDTTPTFAGVGPVPNLDSLKKFSPQPPPAPSVFNPKKKT